MNYDAFSKSDRKKFLKLTLAQLRLESAANARLVLLLHWLKVAVAVLKSSTERKALA